MDLGNLMNAAKALSLTDEQKAMVKKVVTEAKGNKQMIVDGLNKAGIKVSADQIDTVVKMAEKL